MVISFRSLDDTRVNRELASFLFLEISDEERIIRRCK